MSEAIDGMVRERRQALARPQHEERWGLALSGGGIRSATFCFGLLQALAARGLLLRFDLLSTVSGGGYIGGALGRLFQRARSPADVRAIEAAIGAGPSWFSWWLRANGYYLTPQGASDRIYALAVYLRNFLGVHVELGVVGLALGCALAALNVAGWSALDLLLRHHASAVFDVLRDGLHWLPTLWVLLVPLAAAASLAVLADWAVVLSIRTSPWGRVLVLALWLAGLVLFRERFMGDAAAPGGLTRLLLWWASAVLGVLSLLAFVLVGLVPRLHRARRRSTDDARHRTTLALNLTLKLTCAVLLLGLLDRAAWWLAWDAADWAQAGVSLGVAAATLRMLLPWLPQLPQVGGGRVLLRVADLAGRVLSFLLLMWWVAVVHKAALSALFTLSPSGRLNALGVWPALGAVCLIFVFAASYAVFTGRDAGFLNLSSLHGFYRSRLIRSYLGASNAARFTALARGEPLGALGPPNEMGETSMAVRDVDAGDDVLMDCYAPHRHGGPVHLINACLNETTNPTGGLFNRDRRGRLLTVAPGGLLRQNGGHWKRRRRPVEPLTLGSWVAISGAAMAPGLGGMTRGGLASLAMFAGARLGFWWPSAALARQRGGLSCGKSMGLVREALGIFSARGDWFLTDGGHFENTAAYALLAERCRFILVADCGADPQYRFQDLENLVRKARIDLAAEIVFLRPDPAQRAGGPAACFGALRELAASDGTARFALARVRYAGDASPKIGHLLVVKPNLCRGLPIDLFNFKAEHPDFPQQGTADQFFDEAQWESYAKLGRALPEPLTAHGLHALLAHADEWFVDDDGLPGMHGDRPAAAPAAATSSAAGAKPLRPGPRTVAAASLGVGVLAAGGLTAWQVSGLPREADEVQRQTDTQQAVIAELSALWAKLPARPVPGGEASPGPEAAAAANALAAGLARASGRLCAPGEARPSRLMAVIAQGARDACRDEGGGAPACTWLLGLTEAPRRGPLAACFAPGGPLGAPVRAGLRCVSYWGWDYRSEGRPPCAHPEDLARREHAGGPLRPGRPDGP